MGKTIVMVTHDPRALRFVDDVFHLDKGRLLRGGEAERAGRALRAALGVEDGRLAGLHSGEAPGPEGAPS
jgi:ABC-type lipoprotein export system ATPase subunit